jgi:hypothetical protein
MTDALKERFWSKVNKTDEDSCWLWTGGIFTNTGYGTFRYKGKSMNAHRVALELSLGRPILPGMDAAHEPQPVCHTRACVNPNHLYEATRSENMLDRHLDGTQPTTGYQPRLSDDKVRAIRADPRPQVLIAEEYGITQPAISFIKNGKTYRSVS